MTPAEWKDVDLRAVEGLKSPFEKEYFHKDGRRVPVMSQQADPGTGPKP